MSKLTGILLKPTVFQKNIVSVQRCLLSTKQTTENKERPLKKPEKQKLRLWKFELSKPRVESISKIVKSAPQSYKYVQLAAARSILDQCKKNIKYDNFFEEVDVTDNQETRFLLLELSIWMISRKFITEGRNGKLLRQNMIELLHREYLEEEKGVNAEAAVKLQKLLKFSNQRFDEYDKAFKGGPGSFVILLCNRFFSDKNNQAFFELTNKIGRFILEKGWASISFLGRSPTFQRLINHLIMSIVFRFF